MIDELELFFRDRPVNLALRERASQPVIPRERETPRRCRRESHPGDVVCGCDWPVEPSARPPVPRGLCA